ncbi:hypothetical protein [Streptomyces sp. WAC01280]|uniref:hypothetical protein n=1 Tax=Streptomyces sp. WAC01280 TaxID=2487424 RepID=UPI000F793C6E|nr:hypothetical protein [Streptomyces sp. WAC01280]RSS53024.1 hypothetical protein EF909_26215 [Streptomyces sp. WAC01280]
MSGMWVGPARLFEGVSYSVLDDLEFGENGYEDAPDEYVRTLLPILTRWRKQLEKKRAELRGLPDGDYRKNYERWLREESEAYQRALLKLSEAWLLHFFRCDGSGLPKSMIFDMDGGES